MDHGHRRKASSQAQLNKFRVWMLAATSPERSQCILYIWPKLSLFLNRCRKTSKLSMYLHYQYAAYLLPC